MSGVVCSGLLNFLLNRELCQTYQAYIITLQMIGRSLVRFLSHQYKVRCCICWVVTVNKKAFLLAECQISQGV